MLTVMPGPFGSGEEEFPAGRLARGISRLAFETAAGPLADGNVHADQPPKPREYAEGM